MSKSCFEWNELPAVLTRAEHFESAHNYHLLTTAQSNSTQAGIRYMRSLGANASPFGRAGAVAGGGRRQNQGPAAKRQLSTTTGADSASDNVNIFPQLGGKASSEFELAAGGLHGGLPPIHQHLQCELEPSQTPT